MSKRAAAKWERILRAEGLPAELPAVPSWRSIQPGFFRQRKRGGSGVVGGNTRVLVELPSDRDNYQQTAMDRARNFICDAAHTPGYNARLEELYWRGDWAGFPKWHRQLIWAHVQDGTTVAEFSRARRVPYAAAWRALGVHERRAGIGGADMGNQQQQTSRVEQTAAVRVTAVFSEKLDMHLGLGHIKYAEGELVMGGRFVRIEFQKDKPHAKHDHVLIPVGPGVSIAVHKE